ncbi:hypothetical protein [Microbacterium panaciterrae]|uniref:Uncharacterized protein n=1 Tax=Microbacterium panaciterrae TaxID=985759 RepID=A0ABP8PKV1_9MICO
MTDMDGAVPPHGSSALGALTMQQVLIALEEPETAAESIPIPVRARRSFSAWNAARNEW